MLDAISTRRREIFAFYQAALFPLTDKGVLQLPQVPAACDTNCHMFYILVQNAETRDALIQHLKQHGVQATFHYVPLHTSGMGKKLGWNVGDLPITEDISSRLIRLPFFTQITEDQQSFVANQIRDFLLR